VPYGEDICVCTVWGASKKKKTKTKQNCAKDAYLTMYLFTSFLTIAANNKKKKNNNNKKKHTKTPRFRFLKVVLPSKIGTFEWVCSQVVECHLIAPAPLGFNGSTRTSFPAMSGAAFPGCSGEQSSVHVFQTRSRTWPGCAWGVLWCEMSSVSSDQMMLYSLLNAFMHLKVTVWD